MGSRIRFNWKVIIPLVGLLGIALYLSTTLLSTTQKINLPYAFKDIHDLVGDGSPKTRRRPDLNLHHHHNEISSPDLRLAGMHQTSPATHKAIGDIERLHVAIVACGDNADGALTALKSITLFTRKPFKFHIFTEDHLQSHFLSTISKWPAVATGQLVFDVERIQFPNVDDPQQWQSMFKPCASQRLFLPLLLKDVDSVLYIDTDVLALVPLERIWELFQKFNSTQLATLVAESEVETTGWYNRFARHPYYGKFGLNSGVMLMNLTRMRQVNFFNLLLPLYRKYKLDIVWGDQDLLNIVFHFHPEMVLTIPCHWNYRSDHCMYGSECKEIEKEGVFLLHGSRGIFHNDRQPEFKEFYDAFHKFDLASNTVKDLKQWIITGLERFKSTYCGALRNEFLAAINTTA